MNEGIPVLTILDLESDKIEREKKFPELGEILNPAWSPSGRFVVFSALHGGYTDLFLYDLESDTLKNLTDDPYADPFPDWSPDERHIAFSTERFNTAITLLEIGDSPMGLIDVQTGDIREVEGFSQGEAHQSTVGTGREKLIFSL